MRGVGGVKKSIHQSWFAKGFELLCWGFKGVQEAIPSEKASTLPQGQCTSPQLHPCHSLFDQDGHQVTQPPYSADLAPCDFGYSLSSEAVVMRQLRRWKRLWRRSLTRSHKCTSMGPSRCCWNGTTSSLQGLEFHVCTINKSAHTKKVWKLI